MDKEMHIALLAWKAGDITMIELKKLIQEADLANKIESMGQNFRNLTLHSDGRWTVQYRKGGIKRLITGRTAHVAIDKLIVTLRDNQ